jgi:hypothetical protein
MDDCDWKCLFRPVRNLAPVAVTPMAQAKLTMVVEIRLWLATMASPHSVAMSSEGVEVLCAKPASFLSGKSGGI